MNILGSARVRLVVALLGCFLALAACGSGDKKEVAGAEAKLSVAIYGKHASYWPIYVAETQGFFKDEKVVVDLIVPQAGSGITQAVISGSVQIGIGTPDGFILAQSKGQKVHALAALQNIPIGSMLIPPKAKFPNVVKGGLVAVTNEKSGDAYISNKLLEKAGLTPKKDYSFVSAGGTPDRAAALTGGGVQAALIGQPQDFPLIKKGFQRVGLADDVVADFAWQWAVAQDSWAKANPDTVARFLRAVQRGLDWWYDPANADAAVKILAETAKVDDESAQSTYDLWTKKEAFSHDLEPVEPAYAGIIDFMETADLLEGGTAPTFQDFTDISYLTKSRESK